MRASVRCGGMRWTLPGTVYCTQEVSIRNPTPGIRHYGASSVAQLEVETIIPLEGEFPKLSALVEATKHGGSAVCATESKVWSSTNCPFLNNGDIVDGDALGDSAGPTPSLNHNFLATEFIRRKPKGSVFKRNRGGENGLLLVSHTYEVGIGTPYVNSTTLQRVYFSHDVHRE